MAEPMPHTLHDASEGALRPAAVALKKSQAMEAAQDITFGSVCLPPPPRRSSFPPPRADSNPS